MNKYDKRRERLIELINKQYGGNQTSFAKAIRRSPAQINHWKTGERTIGDTIAIDIEKTLNFPYGWFDEDYEIAYSPNAGKNVINKRDKTDQIRFELLNVQASMGNGIFHSEQVEVLDYVTVSREWAKENLGNNLSSIRVITAKGDSMKGTIDSGDVLFVDESVNYFNGEGIYVIAYADSIKAKRLQMQINGSLKIISDNAKYPAEIINADELDAIKICGKVKGAWNLSVF